MDTEKLMKNISDLANYEKIALLDKQLDDFLRVFAELSISDQECYIHSKQFFKNIYDLGYDNGRKYKSFLNPTTAQIALESKLFNKRYYYRINIEDYGFEIFRCKKMWNVPHNYQIS